MLRRYNLSDVFVIKQRGPPHTPVRPLLVDVQVASSMINGLQQGQYHIKTPDLVVNLLISSMASTTPRSYPLLLEACWSPVVVIVLTIYRQILDSVVIRQRKKEETAAPNSQQ